MTSRVLGEKRCNRKAIANGPRMSGSTVIAIVKAESEKLISDAGVLSPAIHDNRNGATIATDT